MCQRRLKHYKPASKTSNQNKLQELSCFNKKCVEAKLSLREIKKKKILTSH